MGKILDLHTFLYMLAYHLCGLGNSIATRTTPVRIPVSMVNTYADVVEEKSSGWKSGKFFIPRKQADIEELIKNSNGEIWLDTDDDAFVCIPQYLMDSPLCSAERYEAEIYLASLVREEPTKNIITLWQFLNDIAIYRFKIVNPKYHVEISFALINRLADKIERLSKNWPDGEIIIERSKDDVAALSNASERNIYFKESNRSMICSCGYLGKAPAKELSSDSERLYRQVLALFPEERALKLYEFVEERVKEMINTNTVSSKSSQYIINELFTRLKDIWVNCIVTHNENRIVDLPVIQATAARNLFIDLSRIIYGWQLSQMVLHYHRKFGNDASIINDAICDIYDLNGDVRPGCEHLAKIINEHMNDNDVDMVINLLLIYYIERRLTVIRDEMFAAFDNPFAYGNVNLTGMAYPGLGQVKPIWDKANQNGTDQANCED